MTEKVTPIRPDLVWVDTNFVDDPEIKKLSTEEFGRQWLAAAKGEKNLVSRFIRRTPP